MANVDAPNGFRPVYQDGGGCPPVNAYLHSASDDKAIAVGDMLISDASYPGYVKIAVYDSGSLIGVAASSLAASTLGTVMVYDSPDTVFVGQCSGDSAQTVVNKQCDIEGTTGIMEVNEDLTTESVIVITKLDDTSDEVGTNGRVFFKIQKHWHNGNQTA